MAQVCADKLLREHSVMYREVKAVLASRIMAMDIKELADKVSFEEVAYLLAER